MDRKLQRHRTVSLRLHGFLVSLLHQEMIGPADFPPPITPCPAQWKHEESI